jgi:hypothetical protein
VDGPKRSQEIYSHYVAEATDAGVGTRSYFSARSHFLSARSYFHRQAREASVLGTPSIYSPEELVFLRRVMEEAVNTLPTPLRTSVSKAKIAKRLLDRAATGERDRAQLLASALTDFSDLVRPAG